MSDLLIPPLSFNGFPLPYGYPRMESFLVPDDDPVPMSIDEKTMGALIYSESDLHLIDVGGAIFPILGGIYFPICVSQVRGGRTLALQSVSDNPATVYVLYNMIGEDVKDGK